MRKTVAIVLLAAACTLSLAACHAIYRPDVQQGNLLTKQHVARLKPGLTKQQVVALLGSPSVVSPFNHNQWDYVTTMQRDGGPIKQRTLTLYFNNGALVRKSGSIMHDTPQQLLQEGGKYGPLYKTNLTKKQQQKLEQQRQQGG